jgi:CheY-like chemotaxis protein
MIPLSTPTRPPAADLSRRRRRVLIVEDNQSAADSLRLLLALHGYEARVAYAGPDGVRLAQEWPAAAVLCDIGLPGLDGYAVTTALRQLPATAQPRLIAVTAYDSDAARRRSREVGFERHLVKPVDPGVLLDPLAAPASLPAGSAVVGASRRAPAQRGRASQPARRTRTPLPRARAVAAAAGPISLSYSLWIVRY